ncbi:hypothetical protein [Parvularcula marina]|uniref:hypothetical protein n=1 Tax=Parvularcula marina TaxID=2292771 RepID=UPI003519B598
MTNTAEERSYAANSISGMVREYERNLLELAETLRQAEESDDVVLQRKIRGLQLSNKWIVADAIATDCHELDDLRAKLELWRLSVLGTHGERPRSPEEELIASVQEDLARLSLDK